MTKINRVARNIHPTISPIETSVLNTHLYQMGIPEWSSHQVYFTGSITNVGGQLYSSTIDQNIGNNPMADQVRWQPVVTKSPNPADIYYATFFNPDIGFGIQLYSSLDGKSFGHPTTLSIDDSLMTGRDPSLAYFKGAWYLAVTGYQLNQFDMLVFKSTDLVSWQRHECILGAAPVCGRMLTGNSVVTGLVWAPELTIIQDELYALVSLQSKENQVDIEGRSIPYFSLYATKLINAENVTFSEPRLIHIQGADTNRIDPDIVFDERRNHYVMAVKNEYNKTIELYQSQAPFCGYEFLAKPTFTKCEGPCLVKTKSGKMRIYVDYYLTGEGIFYCETEDYQTFTVPQKITPITPMRHGVVRRMTDKTAASQSILSLTSPSTSTTQTLVMTRIYGGTHIIEPTENTLYFVVASDKAIVTFQPSATAAKRFFVSVRSQSNGALIVVKNAIAGSAGGDFYIGNGAMKDIIIEFAYDTASRKYVPVGMPFINHPAPIGVLGANINGSANHWIPDLGRVLTINDADGLITLHNLPLQVNNGHYFYICSTLTPSNNTAPRGLLLKAGKNIMLPNNQDYLIDEKSHGKLIKLEKQGTSWFIQL